MISYIIYNNIDIIIAVPIAILFVFALYMGLKKDKPKEDLNENTKNKF